MSERVFPMLDGPPIPWATAETIYAAYSVLHGSQSLECIAERGGFGWSEVPIFFQDLKRKNPALHKKLTGR